MKSNQPAHVAASDVLSQNEKGVLNRCRREIITRSFWFWMHQTHIPLERWHGKLHPNFPWPFRAANKQNFNATGIGKMTINVPNGVETSRLQLTEVSYSPEVGYTLISIGNLNDKVSNGTYIPWDHSKNHPERLCYWCTSQNYYLWGSLLLQVLYLCKIQSKKSKEGREQLYLVVRFTLTSGDQCQLNLKEENITMSPMLMTIPN